MPRTKNNFLNAKPVSKMGGKSGGVRKPSKPYSKPPTSKKAKPKVKAKAAKPTPKPVAPTVKGPAPRPGLQNRGGTTTKDLLPNSTRRGANLPKGGAHAFRSRTQGPKAPTAAKSPNVVTKPVTRSGPVKGPVPPKGSNSVSMPNSRRAGVNLPKTGARAERTATRVSQLKSAAKAAPKAAAKTAGRLAGAAKVAGRIVTPLAILNQAADVLRVGRQNKRWDAYKERMGMNQKPNSTKRRGQGSGNKPRSTDMKPAAKPQQQGPQQTPQMVADYKAKRDARHKALRDKMPAAKPRPTGSNTSPARTPRPAGKVPASAPRSQTPAKPRFKGSAEEGRRIWAEKYSSSKYDGQAIQKEAKKLLEEMKKRKSGASKAGWDGNKNY